MEIRKLCVELPPLETKRLFLSRINAADAKEMFAYSRQKRVTRFLTWKPHKRLSYTKAYIELLQEKYDSGEFFDWGVHTKDDGRFIGTCGFTSLNEHTLCGEIGYVFAPHAWGKGYATESAKRVMAFGFETLGLKEITSRFIYGNHKSEAVMKRLNMTCRGVLPDPFYIKGVWQTVIEYRITKEAFEGENE